MRFLRFLLVCVSFLVVACSARATRINIPDPDPIVGITPVTSSPFGVVFSDDCATLLPNSRVPEKGCFGFLNRSGYDWTALDLILKSDDPSAFSFTCNDQSPGTPVFSTAACGYNRAAGEYELQFSDGVIPNGTQRYFVVTEDDLDPSAITFQAYPTYAGVTPEPPAATLLGLGGLCGTLLMWSRRRSLA